MRFVSTTPRRLKVKTAARPDHCGAYPRQCSRTSVYAPLVGDPSRLVLGPLASFSVSGAAAGPCTRRYALRWPLGSVRGLFLKLRAKARDPLCSASHARSARETLEAP